jgi:hypothetical protein
MSTSEGIFYPKKFEFIYSVDGNSDILGAMCAMDAFRESDINKLYTYLQVKANFLANPEHPQVKHFQDVWGTMFDELILGAIDSQKSAFDKIHSLVSCAHRKLPLSDQKRCINASKHELEILGIIDVLRADAVDKQKVAHEERIVKETPAAPPASVEIQTRYSYKEDGTRIRRYEVVSGASTAKTHCENL